MKRIYNTKFLKKKKIVQSAMTIISVIILMGIAGCGKAKESSNELSFDSTIDVPREDFKEVRPEGNRANIMNPLNGGSDVQAEELRKKIVESKDEVTVKGKKYYISADGDDLNDGLSPETAFRTLDVLTWLPISEGDAILLERGSIFRITEPIVAISGVTYGAYGEGEKPCIYGSPNNYADSSLWTPSRKKNVWKLDFGYEDAGNIVFNHGESVGIKKIVGLNQLENTGDFYHNDIDGVIYMYCAEGNPGNQYKDIEISPRVKLFNLTGGVSGITVDNWCFKYSGAFAISGTKSNNHIKITNCEIGYIGGSRLNVSSRYGNGIQFWNGTQDTEVRNCWIYQTFDTAVTFQGTSENEYKNITFSDNLLEYNDMDIELWDHGEEFKVQNLVIENNIMRFNSQGWGTRTEDRGKGGGASCFKFDFANCVSLSGSFKNNIFDCPRYIAVYYNQSPNGTFDVDISQNTIYATQDRGNRGLMRCGMVIENKIPEEIKVENQLQLQEAFKKFDSNPGEVLWVENP